MTHEEKIKTLQALGAAAEELESRGPTCDDVVDFIQLLGHMAGAMTSLHWKVPQARAALEADLVAAFRAAIEGGDAVLSEMGHGKEN